MKVSMKAANLIKAFVGIGLTEFEASDIAARAVGTLVDGIRKTAKAGKGVDGFDIASLKRHADSLERLQDELNDINERIGAQF